MIRLSNMIPYLDEILGLDSDWHKKSKTPYFLRFFSHLFFVLRKPNETFCQQNVTEQRFFRPLLTNPLKILIKRPLLIILNKSMNLKPNLTKLGGDQFLSHVPMVRLGGITLVFARTNK